MNNNKSYRKIKIDKNLCLNIASDAAINNKSVSYGKLIPLIILDTVDIPEISHMIQTHTGIKQGRIDIQWIQEKTNDKFIYLFIKMLSPIKLKFLIKFDTIIHGGLIDLIVSSQQLYIQAGKQGDRLKHNINLPKLLIEVPSTEFRKTWLLIYTRIYVKHFRKLGYSKKEALRITIKLRNEWGIMRDLQLK